VADPIGRCGGARALCGTSGLIIFIRFFITHGKTSRTTKIPTIVIEAMEVCCKIGALIELSQATQHIPDLSIRVVERGWDVIYPTDNLARYFFEHIEGLEHLVVAGEEGCAAKSTRRGWRLWPCDVDKESMDCLRKYLTVTGFEQAKRVIENGM
jgi:hypothetical protein